MFKKKEILTVPNLLSLIRLLLVPVIYILYHYHHTMIAVGVILFSGSTDIADGWVARKFNMTSDFGKFFDALSDKLTEAVMIVLIIPNHSLYIAPFILLLIKEGIMIMYGFVALKASNTVNSAKWHGKVNTFVIYVVMITMFVFRDMPLWLEIVLVSLSCSSQLMSLILYVIFYHKFLKSSKCTKEVKFSYSKYLILLVWFIAVIVTLICSNDISLSDILNYTPSNLWIASIVLLGLFALKSMIFIIHIDLLYIASGILLPLPLALGVDVLGTLITFIIPYFIARRQGYEMIEKLCEKYPKVNKIAKKRKENDFMFSFMVRLAGGIPYDIVSYLMGSLGVNFVNYLISGLIAIIPDIVLCQIAGSSINDPTSPAFLITVGIKVAKILISVLIVFFITKHKKKKNSAESQEIKEPSNDGETQTTINGERTEAEENQDYVLINQDGIIYPNDKKESFIFYKRKKKKTDKKSTNEHLNLNEKSENETDTEILQNSNSENLSVTENSRNDDLRDVNTKSNDDTPPENFSSEIDVNK